MATKNPRRQITFAPNRCQMTFLLDDAFWKIGMALINPRMDYLYSFLLVAAGILGIWRLLVWVEERKDKSWIAEKACKSFCDQRQNQGCSKSDFSHDNCPHPENLNEAKIEFVKAYSDTLDRLKK